MTTRSEANRRFMSLVSSDDNGRTWSKSRPLTNPNEVPGRILALHDGRVLATFGVRHLPLGIQALISPDGGETWPAEDPLMLAWSAGHPFSIELPDGRVFRAYCRLADPFDPASCQVEGLFWTPPCR